MKYKELLELYKQGKLEEEKAKEIQYDIERQEAISDYLFEEDIPGFERMSDLNNEENKDNSRENVQDIDLKFAKMINKSIRKAFIRLGVSVAAVVLAVILFIQFALPGIVSAMYYNPDKLIKEQTRQFELDMAIYTELFVPEQLRENVVIESKGYGEYEFRILQSYSYTRNFTDVAGNIKRNEITFYNSNIIRQFTGNAFVRTHSCIYEDELNKALSELITDENRVYSAAGSVEYAKETVNNLDEDKVYNAYVSFDKLINYDDFVKFIDENEYAGTIWCAPVVSMEDNNVGFYYSQGSGSFMEWDEEKYPMLKLWNVIADDEAMKKPENAQQHFTDMLSYMSEQKAFCEMMDIDANQLEAYKEYIDNNGIQLHGFMIITDKQTIQHMFEQEEVYIIYTTDIKS